ncbi:MAG: hypothetical protein Q9199_000653 [Rusavskia elegans]
MRDDGLSWQNCYPRIHKEHVLPHNTRHYIMTTERSSRHINNGHYLMLIIKRGSRYWNCLWDDIIREAREELVKVDSSTYFQREDNNGQLVPNKAQAVGKANPSVVLTVGFEVRLFEWRRTEPDGDVSKDVHFDGTLTETNPGKIYSILDSEDRNAIKVVLRAAKQRLIDAPRSEHYITASERQLLEGNGYNKVSRMGPIYHRGDINARQPFILNRREKLSRMKK